MRRIYLIKVVRRGLNKLNYRASDAQTNDQFGDSVGICGDYAIVGAPYEDSGADYGVGYIYTTQDTTGTGK